MNFAERYSSTIIFLRIVVFCCIDKQTLFILPRTKMEVRCYVSIELCTGIFCAMCRFRFYFYNCYVTKMEAPKPLFKAKISGITTW